MPAVFKDIDSILEQINDKLLLYRLNRHCPGRSTLKKTAKLDPFEEERFFRDLESRISGEMEDLVIEKDGTASLSPSAPVNIVSYTRETAEYLGLLDFSINRLVDLKQRLVSHQQDLLFRLVRSYLNVMPVAFRGMLAGEDSDQAFMMDASSGWLDERKDLMCVFSESLKESGVYDMEGCMDMVRDVLFMKNDLKTGANMLKMVEEHAIFYAMSPAGFSDGNAASLKMRFGSYKHDYARLWIDLEEMGFRLNGLGRKGEGLIVRVFNRDDYAEDLGPDDERLRRKAEDIGGEGMLESMREGRLNLENVVKQVAAMGPMHLSLAKDYLDIFVRNIRGRSFGISTSGSGGAPRRRYLVIKEPKRFMVLDSATLRSLGLDDTRISELTVESGVAYGILSGYTPVEFPLDPYSGPIPREAGRFSGRLYTADSVKVIDLYSHEDAVPEGILDCLRGGRALDDPEVTRMIEGKGLPGGTYQLRMPYQVLMLNDLSVISERRKKKKDALGRPLPVIELYEKRDDSGIHDQFAEFIDSQPYSRMVCREALEGMVRGRRGQGK